MAALKRDAEALEVFGSLLRPNAAPKRVSPDVFIGLASAYEALGRFCEEAATLETYIAVDPEQGGDPELDAQIKEGRRRGACEGAQDAAAIVVPRPPSGVVRVRADINGVAGNFALDTGATWVTLSPDFARRAKLEAASGGPARLDTMNGVTSVKLVSVGLIRLGRLEASHVPGVVSGQAAAKDVDGVLGMSFLSRFDLTLTDKEWRLKTRARN